MTALSAALAREIKPEFFRVLAGRAGALYLDALDALHAVAMEHPGGIDRDDALAVVEHCVEEHRDLLLEEMQPEAGTLSPSPALPAIPPRERARAALEYLRESGWLEEEERSDWRRLIHFHPNGLLMIQTIRKLAFPQAIVFSDKLVSVCTTLAASDPAEDPEHPLRTEPWQHVESCLAALHEGIAELRGMQMAIERHTRQQLAAATLRENLTVLFDKFAEQIGRACYAELVRSRLPLRLAQARRLVEELEADASLGGAMQAEVQRRHPTFAPEKAAALVREKLTELSELLQSVVPVADAVDRRTAEFTRRSLARFRYLQETTSENRATVQSFFETLNRHFTGQRLASLDPLAVGVDLRVQEISLFSGTQSLYTPHLRRAAGEIEPLDEEATEGEQGAALRRLQSAMRDSLTVGRANRFVDMLLSEPGESLSSGEVPIHCEEDLADLIACLLHAGAADARYKIGVPRLDEDADTSRYDARLSYRIERFTLTRK